MLVDSMGFGDPTKSPGELWNKYVFDTTMNQKVNLRENGFGAIIFPIMLGPDCRLPDMQIELMNQLLTLLTLSFP